MPILAVLLPVILGHIGLHAALLAVTLPQWIAIASEVAKALPAVLKDLKALHPVFDRIVADISAGHGHRIAGMNAHGYMSTLAKNADAAIRVQDALPH